MPQDQLEGDLKHQELSIAGLRVFRPLLKESHMQARDLAGSLLPAQGNLSDQLTVIVPAYNEASSLAETILSLQRQTYPPHEIIVVDDCSTDDTS